MFHNCQLLGRIFTGIMAIGFLATQATAQITSQWRGANRDGIYNGENLLDLWPQEGPKLLFTAKKLGSGHASPAVTGERIYVTGLVEKVGYLSALDHTGKEIWKVVYGPEWDASYPGVRGTPTVEGDRLYLMSGKGRLVCFNSADGKEIWSVDMMKDFKGQKTKWGFSESVLIDGDQLFCAPGGKEIAVAALDKKSGKVLWSTAANGEKSGYCSPILIKHGGKKILVTMLAKSIVGLEATTGKLLWRREHKTSYGINANSPIYTNGNLLCFSGYGQGAVMLKLSEDGQSVKQVWSNPKFDVQIGGAVLIGDRLYGSAHKKAAWHCVDVTTGKILYSNKEIGRGSLIAAGGLLYCYSEKGKLSLMKPGADKFTVLSTFPIKEGKGQHWAHPVIKDSKLYLRHGEVLLVYAIGK